ELEERSACERGCVVPIGELTAVRLIRDHPHARVEPLVPASDVESAVGRSIVNHEQLEIAPRLTEHALDGLRDVLFAVICSQEDADRRNHHILNIGSKETDNSRL